MRSQILPAHQEWGADHFEVHYASALRSPTSFHDECRITAEHLAREANGEPLFVMMSGGIDGEVVARSFLEIGKSFTPVLFEYRKHQPDDLFHVHDFSRRYGLKLKVITFDELQFFKTELPKIADEHTERAILEPFVAFDLARMRALDGYSVFGAGDIVLEVKSDGLIVSYESGSLFQAETMFRGEGGRTCYQFFQATAELMLAFLNEPILKTWIDLQPTMHFQNSRKFKYYLFKSIWPDLQPRIKWTGYERFAPEYLAAEEWLKRRARRESLPEYKVRYDIPLSQLLRELTSVLSTTSNVIQT